MREAVRTRLIWLWPASVAAAMVAGFMLGSLRQPSASLPATTSGPTAAAPAEATATSGSSVSTALPTASVLPTGLASPSPLPVDGVAPWPVAKAGKIDAVFRRYFGHADPGCAVGISERGVVYGAGYGLADLASSTSITPSTVFDTMLSEPLIATAVWQLVDLGKIRWTDDVRTWVPELPRYTSVVTIADLLYQRSGIPDLFSLLNLRDVAGPPMTDADHLAALAQAPTLAFPPGSRFGYSISNYFLLGVIVERADGRSLAQFTNERIFQALAMASTNFPGLAYLPVPTIATVYRLDARGRYVPVPVATNPVGPRIVHTSVIDLLAWGDAMITGHLVGAPGIRDLLTSGAELPDGYWRTSSEFDPGTGGYSAGVSVGRRRGVALVTAAAGNTTVSGGAIVIVPSRQLVIAALCNHGIVPIGSVLEVLDAWIGTGGTQALGPVRPGG